MMEKDVLLNRMRALCSRREYCRADIRCRMQRGMRGTGELPAALQEEILDTLCREGFVDEGRYAAAFARDRSALHGWGKRRIELALNRKRIPDDAIRKALEGIDTGRAGEKMVALLSARLRSLRDESEEVRRAKLFRYGMGRGYSYDQIKQYYDHYRTT